MTSSSHTVFPSVRLFSGVPMKTPMLPSRRFAKLAATLAFLSSAGLSPAAIAVTNGTFGTTNQNARIVDGGGWFESTTTTNWIEGSWSNGNLTTFPTGTGMALLFDGGGSDLGYLYQSIGTVSAADIAAGFILITSDFAEKADGSNNDARFDLLVGNFATANTGVDILSGGSLTSLFSRTMTAAQQGLTAATGDMSRSSGVTVGTVNISGLNAGDQIWLRIGESRLTTSITGDLIVDNITATVVPEPSSLMLLGVVGAAFTLRRRRTA